MAVKDIRSDLEQKLVLNEAISSDTTTVGAIIDTADFELGLMFAMMVTAFTTGDFTLILEEADTVGFSGSTVISGDQLIGTLPFLDALTADGSVLLTVGVISNKQFVRVSVLSDNTGVGTVQVIATEKGEYLPVI